ncbi:MAG TPA: hypothetical protein VNR36_08170 [Pseudolysinimonas sp.]|nr:hypothetical protein [Pseudolysinimonas sp.]
MSQRTVVLLGAGASFDAGLPLTSQLAERIVARFNAQRPPVRGVQELNFVYSAMIGHQGEDGSDPLRAVNIETLVSAVRLLQARESHEVAPFVSSWKPGALGFAPERAPMRHHGRALRDAVERSITDEHFGGDSLAEVIADIAMEANEPPDASAYKELEVALLQAIREELQSIDTIDYLQPLADLATSQSGGLDIVTLNYDLAIEKMAAEMGVRVDRGMDRWRAGFELTFMPTDGVINLIKLHGSVDWELVGGRPSAVQPPGIRVVEPEPERDELDPNAPPRRTPGLPWIVVGDREKLATDGPTLDLLNAATEALRRADSLVVVGYSFADAHVNAAVRNWLAASEDRTMTVIDPAWPAFDSLETRGYLARAYGGGEREGEPGAPPRLAVLTQGAAAALGTGLTLVPSTPELTVTGAWTTDYTTGEVIIDLGGYSLDQVSVTAQQGPHRTTHVYASAEDRDRGQVNWFSGPNFGHQPQGSRLHVFLGPDQIAETVKLYVSGRDLLGHRRFAITLEGRSLDGIHPESLSR